MDDCRNRKKPKYKKSKAKVGKPNSATRRAEIVNPILTRLWAGAKLPKFRRSKTKSGKSKREVSETDMVRSQHAD